MDLDKEAPRGEFAVYLNDERIFSRLEKGRLPDPQELIQQLRLRIFGTAPVE